MNIYITYINIYIILNIIHIIYHNTHIQRLIYPYWQFSAIVLKWVLRTFIILKYFTDLSLLFLLFNNSWLFMKFLSVSHIENECSVIFFFSVLCAYFFLFVQIHYSYWKLYKIWLIQSVLLKIKSDK